MYKETITFISKANFKDVYEVVSDVESYPEFIPFILESELIEKDKEASYFRVKVGRGSIFSSYISKVVFIFERKRKKYMIVATSNDETFKKLNTVWELSEKGDHTLVNFEMEIEFRSKLLSKMIIPLIKLKREKIIEAFENRLACKSFSN